MTVIKTALATDCLVPYPLIDTHTHFDAPVFDHDRAVQAERAYSNGVRHLVLVGYLQQYFARLYATQSELNRLNLSHLNIRNSNFDQPESHLPANKTIKNSKPIHLYPQAHIALGLHPFYIDQHTEVDLVTMAQMLEKQRPLAIGEIGLDTFTEAMRTPENKLKQQRFFEAQLNMAVTHQLPVMLHIRKAHAEALALLKAHEYDAHKLGGIAHSFSGGEQEAKAFVKLGFKLGVTGQITNPNAKKLRRAIQAAVDTFGIECLVLETDCPDMTPIACQVTSDKPASLDDPHSQSATDEWQRDEHYHRNVPANLPWVLSGLSELLAVASEVLAPQLWQNSCDALRTNWSY